MKNLKQTAAWVLSLMLTLNCGISAFAEENYSLPENTETVNISTADYGSVLNKVTNIQSLENTETSNKFTWNTVNGADGYEVYQYRSDKNGYIKIGETVQNVYTNSNKSAGTKYEYKVRAFAYSNGVRSYGGYSDVFTTCTNLKNLNGLCAKDTGRFHIFLKWGKVSKAEGYEIYTVSNDVYTKVGDTKALEFDVKNLNIFTGYTFAVRPYRTVNGVRYFSSDFTGYSDYTKFQQVEFTSSSSNESSVTLNWKDIDIADSYEIMQNVNGKFVLIGTTSNTSYKINNLTPNTKYTFKVRGIKWQNNEKRIGLCGQINVSTKSVPVGKVLNIVSSKNTETSNKFTWNTVNGADGYEVYQYRSDKNGYIKIGETAQPVYTNSNKSAGTKYEYKVRAFVYSNGVKSYGEYSDVFTTCTNLKNLNGLSAKDTGRFHIFLKWSKVSKAEGYEVYKVSNNVYTKVGDTKALEFDVKNLNIFTGYTFAVRPYRTVNGVRYFSSDFTVYSDYTKFQQVEFTSSSSNTNSVTLNWKNIGIADSYEIMQKINGNFVLIGTTSSTGYTINNLNPNTKYTFKVRGIKWQNNQKRIGLCGQISVSTKKDTNNNNNLPANVLYSVNVNSYIYDTNYNYLGMVYAGDKYTGYSNSNYSGYAVINYKSGKALVSKSNVSVCRNAKVLPTGTISQIGGEIAGYASCGPTTAAILVNSEKNTKWNKDDLIRYAERNNLNDQGSLRTNGGMTAPNLVKLIRMYSNGAYSAKNIYSYGDQGAAVKKQIDAGKRCLVLVQYTSTIVNNYASATHFVVVCGYEYINGELYFYYADPYYNGNSGRSLRKVSASLLNLSMNMIVREPRCLIVLN